jgi:hypothetical protein
VTITVEEVYGYSRRVVRVFADGRPVCTLSDPDPHNLTIPGIVPEHLVNPVVEAVLIHLTNPEPERP